ncbi:MAG: septal ring lytic transglycosylase RlpA family protein, partial [Pseudolabrys sp.]
MKLIEAKKIVRWVARRLAHFSFLLALGGVFSVMPMPSVSSENSFDRIQAGTWVVASMYWEDKLVSTGKAFNPIGWHAAHKTLPIGTLIRVSNPKNHRSINVTINDRGPFVANRDLDLSLGAGHIAGTAGAGHRLYGNSVDSADKAGPASRGKFVRGQRGECQLRWCPALLRQAIPRATA